MAEYFDHINLRRLKRLIAHTPFARTPEINTSEIEYREDWYTLTGETFQLYLKEKIVSGEPFMLTRFGAGVLRAAIDYSQRFNFKNTIRYLMGGVQTIDLQRDTVVNLCGWDGFYPARHDDIMEYGKMINEIIPNIDILGSIIYQERYYAEQLSRIVRCRFYDLEPWRWKQPWTKALEGRKVLVVHPFIQSIRSQYKNNRKNLFSNPDCLPEFDLKVLRAVQDKKISNDPYDQYDSFFDAYRFLCAEIDKIDFDIAILGCGAYGMPLANYIKSLGKQAIHIGGAVQFMFGIKSKRSDIDEDATIRNLYNDYWVRPSAAETPQGYKKIEDGCYW